MRRWSLIDEPEGQSKVALSCLVQPMSRNRDTEGNNNMKKQNITINISYSVAETKDSVNDAIGREIHEIETLKRASESKRAQLVAFIRENREAIEVATIEATLKANGYSRQDVSRLLRSYGIIRKTQKKSALSMKVQAKAQAEFEAIRKRYGKDELSAIIRRMYELAKESK